MSTDARTEAEVIAEMEAAFPEDHDAVLRELATAISPRVLESGRRTDLVARQLGEYFDGQRRTFEVPVDLQLVQGFRRAVIEHLGQIPYGSTESYATVARAAGSAGAVRAVGSACGHNPVPVVVPCHRVIRSDGSFGQYRGGAEMKAALTGSGSVPGWTTRGSR